MLVNDRLLQLILRPAGQCQCPASVGPIITHVITWGLLFTIEAVILGSVWRGRIQNLCYRRGKLYHLPTYRQQLVELRTPPGRALVCDDFFHKVCLASLFMWEREERCTRSCKLTTNHAILLGLKMGIPN